MGFNLGQVLGDIAGGAAGFALGGPWGAAMGANLINSAFNSGAQQDINNSNIQASKEQMQFQERMSSTAHQREVSDLEAAGLNPTLSAGGSGSSTPAGSLPSLTAPQINLPDIMSYYTSQKQLEQNAARLSMDQGVASSQIMKNMSEVDLNKMDKIIKSSTLPFKKLEGEGSQNVLEFFNWLKAPGRQQLSPTNNFQPDMSRNVPSANTLQQTAPFGDISDMPKWKQELIQKQNYQNLGRMK